MGVILLALLSACNSDLYSATRVLSHLAEQGSAPRVLAKNMHGVPVVALMLTAAFGLLSLLCDRLGSEAVFLWLVNVSSMAGFMAWFGIALSHYRFRRAFFAKWADAIRVALPREILSMGTLVSVGGLWVYYCGSGSVVIASGARVMGDMVINLHWFSRCADLVVGACVDSATKTTSYDSRCLVCNEIKV